MASLSDQIDRLTRNTRAIKTTAELVLAHNHRPTAFTTAVLHTQLGDLIRDVDPSELGLFTLLHPYDTDPNPPTDHGLRRVEFSGPTPLRSRDHKHDVDPEVFAHAALKCIDQYQPIRPMPRAYDQIVAVLERINTVRENIATLNATLQQTSTIDHGPPPKVRVEQEMRRVNELQVQIAELSKRKENAVQKQKQKHPSVRAKLGQAAVRKEAPKTPLSPSSPQEDKFWNTPMGPSRTLRFTENLMDEQVDLNDISMSFQSPMVSTKTFADLDIVDEETVKIPKLFSDHSEQEPNGPGGLAGGVEPSTDLGQITPPATDSRPSSSVAGNDPSTVVDKSSETPRTRQRKVKVNLEVERIVAKIWSTMGDIIPPPDPASTGAPAVDESISHIRYLAAQSPQPESPVASSVSSVSAEASNAPSFQQIMTANLLMLLLTATPHYSMPLNKVKESLALKAKTSGVSSLAQISSRTTRVVFGCVAKRLVKIDRGTGEQVVKFDI